MGVKAQFYHQEYADGCLVVSVRYTPPGEKLPQEIKVRVPYLDASGHVKGHDQLLDELMAVTESTIRERHTPAPPEVQLPKETELFGKE